MLCSPLRLPSPQFSGNSSEETLQFHAPCVRNYVRWPARMKNEAHGKQNELGEVWKKGGREEGRNRHGSTGGLGAGLAQRG